MSYKTMGHIRGIYMQAAADARYPEAVREKLVLLKAGCAGEAECLIQGVGEITDSSDWAVVEMTAAEATVVDNIRRLDRNMGRPWTSI